MSYGSEDHVTTVLPPGKEQNDYEFGFEVMVSDSLSATSNFPLIIKVGVEFCKFCFQVQYLLIKKTCKPKPQNTEKNERKHVFNCGT